MCSVRCAQRGGALQYVRKMLAVFLWYDSTPLCPVAPAARKLMIGRGRSRTPTAEIERSAYGPPGCPRPPTRVNNVRVETTFGPFSSFFFFIVFFFCSPYPPQSVPSSSLSSIFLSFSLSLSLSLCCTLSVSDALIFLPQCFYRSVGCT